MRRYGVKPLSELKVNTTTKTNLFLSLRIVNTLIHCFSYVAGLQFRQSKEQKKLNKSQIFLFLLSAKQKKSRFALCFLSRH